MGATELLTDVYQAHCERCGRVLEIELSHGVPINRDAFRVCNWPLSMPPGARCWGSVVIEPGGPEVRRVP